MVKIFKFCLLISLLSGCTSYAENKEQFAVNFLANEVIDEVPGFENIKVYFDGQLSKCNLEYYYWEKEGHIPEFPNQISDINCESVLNSATLNLPENIIYCTQQIFQENIDTNSCFLEVSKAVRIKNIDNVLLKLNKNNGDELGVIIGFKPNGEFSKYRVLYYNSKTI